jgi:hypothetical protein
MSNDVKSIEELIQLYFQELQNQNPDLSDTTEGSIIDQLAGVTALAVDEANKLTIQKFAATNFLTAEGQDLENLAVDHFGSAFARPGAVKATGSVTFGRPNTSAGTVVIPAGTIVRTQTTATGSSIQFETTAEVTMTGVSIGASIRALVEGTGGNVLANKIVVIESTLTDPTIVVNNPNPTSGGSAEETDAEYRETILQLLTSLSGATKEAVEEAAKSVAGIETAVLVETYNKVSEISPTGSLIGDPFYTTKSSLYVGDVNGNASSAQIAEVRTAIDPVRAAGVQITILSGATEPMDWIASISLNPSGPNFSELASDPQRIIESMTNYVNSLLPGDDFVVASANAAIMTIWGPSGSNDLISFTTSTPSGNIVTAVNQKLLANTVDIV